MHDNFHCLTKVKLLEQKITRLNKERVILIKELNRYYHIEHLLKISLEQMQTKSQISHLNSEAIVRQSIDFLYDFYQKVFHLHETLQKITVANVDSTKVQTEISNFLKYFSFLKSLEQDQAAIEKFITEFNLHKINETK